MTNRFISWDVPSWTQEIIVEAKISKIGWCEGSAKSSMKIPARMSSDVKNSTANDMTCPLRVITFFRFLRMLKIITKKRAWKRNDLLNYFQANCLDSLIPLLYDICR